MNKVYISKYKNKLSKVNQLQSHCQEVRGVNGRKLIEDKYSMQSVAKQMLELYNWVLTKENKPKFI